MRPDDSFDVIVIGAGIIGLSCAYYLGLEGKKVLLLEKGELGSGTSGACDDMILFQSKKPGLMLEMTFLSLDLYRELSRKLTPDIELQTLGGMILIGNEDHMSLMEDFVAQQKSYGLDVIFLDREATFRKQPFAKKSILGSMYCSQDSQVNPLNVMFGFLAEARAMGMELSTGEKVTGIAGTPLGWKVSTAKGNTFSSEIIVNAAGTWAGEIMADIFGMDIPITPKRGQILVTEASPAIGETNVWSSDYIVSKLHPELSTLDEKSRELGLGMAITRTSDGNYFLGGTREFVGFDKGTTFEAFEAISKTAIDYFPILENLHVIRSFAGLRPACGDGKCIIGEVPGLPGFFIAAGHEGDGIALAPVTGKFLTDLVMGRKTDMDIAELSPKRFLTT